MSNGILALVRLAQSIESAGRTAYVCAYVTDEKKGEDIILKTDLDTYAPQNELEKQFLAPIKWAQKTYGIKTLKNFSQEYINSCYVLYPETICGNPFDAPRIIRYFLNKDGNLNGRKVNIDPGDFILAHSKVMHPAPHHICYFASLNPVFHNEDTYPTQFRKLDITYIGKGELYGFKEMVDGTLLVTRDWPPEKDQLAMLLRNCRFFYTADACSNINVEALACGAIPIFIHNGPWTDEEIDGYESGPIPRISLGQRPSANVFAEFDAARVDYVQRLKNWIDAWEPSVAQMIEKVDRHFGK